MTLLGGSSGSNARPSSPSAASAAVQQSGNSNQQQGAGGQPSSSLQANYVSPLTWRREPRLLFLETLGYASAREEDEDQLQQRLHLQRCLANPSTSTVPVNPSVPTVRAPPVPQAYAPLSSSSSSSSGSSSLQSNPSSSNLPDPASVLGTTVWTDEPPSYEALTAYDGDRQANGPVYASGASADCNGQQRRHSGSSPPPSTERKKLGSLSLLTKKRWSLGSSSGKSAPP